MCCLFADINWVHVEVLFGLLWPLRRSHRGQAHGCKCSSAPVSFHQCEVLVSGGPQVMHSVTELSMKWAQTGTR